MSPKYALFFIAGYLTIPSLVRTFTSFGPKSIGQKLGPLWREWFRESYRKPYMTKAILLPKLKRKENADGFIKKTVLPFPRLG